jgi:hypothetical protein
MVGDRTPITDIGTGEIHVEKTIELCSRVDFVESNAGFCRFGAESGRDH